jgi:hypothetical protein
VPVGSVAGLRWGALVVALAAWTGCSPGTAAEGPSTTTNPAPTGWQHVSYEGIDFEVPSDWPVIELESWDDYGCDAVEHPGLYLAPPEPLPGISCSTRQRDYAATLLVTRAEPSPSPLPVGAEVVGSGVGLRVIQSTSANRWHDVVFPERGIRLVFYEVDDITYEQIADSVRGMRP